MPSYRYTPASALVRYLTAALLFVAAALGLAVLGAAPASAHDSVESTSPTADASLPAPPQKVSITLSNHPLAIGSQIKVNDAGGTNWADGGVQIVDNVASQPLKPGAPAGRFTVQWRVASSDGHPIEGTFGFTAAAAAPGAGTSVSPGATPAAGANTVPTMGTAEPGTTIAPTPVKDASEPFPWSIVIFVAVAIGILVALGLMAKRRLQAGDDDRP
ncbi:copper resistance CopC family protein [Arthrobacter sp. NPDC080082]|uniref:copper resistance CopC family protein n=1 Tax=unclassified Arthrobacter TaxID=235627 RepID=UPI003425F0AD